mmetsp:Transcript_15010/g.31581  ORF Transcript_15010/g.31581 Transcript_15010/m.31581 type:complete len:184 (+) Transcript_15010:338-889(+)
MAFGNNVSVLRDVFDRLSISHVFSGALLPPAGRRRFSRKNGSLCYDDHVRCNFYDRSCTVCQRPLPWKFPDLHDGLCVGKEERRYENELPRSFHFQCPIPPLGHAYVLDAIGESSNNRRYRNFSWPYLLLFGVCVPRCSGNSGLEKEKDFGAPQSASLDLWDLSGASSSSSGLVMQLFEVGFC